jgi:HPt (histidine-containing phosphotransfer) domain-containing protein
MDTIDMSVFNALRETAGADFVTELVNTFFEEAPAILADLRSARAAADAERYRRAAHSLKSNGNTFGAKDFAAQARAIELGGLAADPALDLENIAALEAAYNQAAAALKKLCNG